MKNHNANLEIHRSRALRYAGNRKKMLSHTPLERLGKPADIAGAVLYFAPPVSKRVSGQVLFDNGGGVQTLD